MTLFPDNFIWGISSSAYQTEDRALHSDDPHHFKTDWDLFFDAGFLKYPKGDATFSFTEYERDIAALVSLGVTHYRFNLEWARIEPSPGQFNEEALEHYALIAKALRKAGIVPILCLWHFTFPSWLTSLQDPRGHGWLHPLCEKHWSIYVRKIAEKFSPVVDIYAPQNEPNTQAMCGFLAGIFPPGARLKFRLYYRNMRKAAEAFITAATIIREVRRDVKILSVQNIVYWEKSRWDVAGFFYRGAKEFNLYHLDRVAEVTDWIGFTYYMGETAGPFSIWKQKTNKGERWSDLGWPIHPEGLYHVINELHERYQKPLLIMENGVADEGDLRREYFIDSHLKAIARAIQKGCPVRGYFHWTLIDNFEWFYGYSPKFGLFSMEPATKRLIEKPSANLFKNYTNRV